LSLFLLVDLRTFLFNKTLFTFSQAKMSDNLRLPVMKVLKQWKEGKRLI